MAQHPPSWILWTIPQSTSVLQPRSQALLSPYAIGIARSADRHTLPLFWLRSSFIAATSLILQYLPKSSDMKLESKIGANRAGSDGSALANERARHGATRWRKKAEEWHSWETSLFLIHGRQPEVTISELYIVSRNNRNGKQPISRQFYRNILTAAEVIHSTSLSAHSSPLLSETCSLHITGMILLYRSVRFFPFQLHFVRVESDSIVSTLCLRIYAPVAERNDASRVGVLLAISQAEEK